MGPGLVNPGVNGLRALVVEDDPPLRDVLVSVLRSGGYDTACAATSAGGWARLDAHRPHVVLLDLNLPDERGTVILRRIRAEGRAMRVAVVTGTTDFGLYSAALQLQPDKIFFKPFGRSELTAWLREGDEATRRAARTVQS